MKVSYNWLKEYVGEKMPSVEKLDELLTFHAFEVDGMEKVGDDTVIDVKVLPDRSSDCLSHRGIAREIAALTGTEFSKDLFTYSKETLLSTDSLEITIGDTTQCARLMFARMSGITVTDSPEWLKTRLSVLGQRSINNVVDATNYVMLATGQPLHAYDADKISHDGDVWKIGTRMAKDGEEITTLSQEVCTLDSSVQLIVDSRNDTPLSLAGVKGGAPAEVDKNTTSIILEAGNFNPQTTRKAAQKLKLPTDAAKRFENNVSPEVAVHGLHEVISLIGDIAGGKNEGIADVYAIPAIQTEVTLTHHHVESLLGLTISRDDVEDIFARLGFTYEANEDGWSVKAPIERTDIRIPEDAIAEVGRMYGYEHITSVLPEHEVLTEYNASHYYSEKVREVLIVEGVSEVITSSFRDKDSIELHNALASDKRFLRSSLRKNMEEVLDKNIGNLDLLGLEKLQIFEIGTVFAKTTNGKDVTEYTSLTLGVRTKQSGFVPKDDISLTELVVLVEAALGVELNGEMKEGIFECNFSNVVAKLPTPTQYEPVTPAHDTIFTPYSVFPYITRDIALWVPETVTAEEIESLIGEQATNLLVRLSLFDEFKKDDRTSYAFRLVFQSFDKTLTDDEIQPIMSAIESVLRQKGFEVR